MRRRITQPRRIKKIPVVGPAKWLPFEGGVRIGDEAISIALIFATTHFPPPGRIERITRIADNQDGARTACLLMRQPMCKTWYRLRAKLKSATRCQTRGEAAPRIASTLVPIAKFAELRPFVAGVHVPRFPGWNPQLEQTAQKPSGSARHAAGHHVNGVGGKSRQVRRVLKPLVAKAQWSYRGSRREVGHGEIDIR